MANWKGHVGGGVAFASIYAGTIAFLPINNLAGAAGFLHNWQAVLAVFLICILFALFPDVDTNSKGQDILYFVLFGLDIVLIATGNVLAAAYLGLIAMLPILGHHRGWTHKKWAMIVVPLPILLVPFLYNEDFVISAVIFYGAAVIGYFSHLLFDGLMTKGF